MIDLRESDNPSVFRGLRRTEIVGLLDFLYLISGLNLTRAKQSKIDTNYIYLADLYPAPKTEVLKYLDGKCKQPAREAHVIIYRGAITTPDVIEIIVSPLPNPTYYRHIPYYPKSLPFVTRPPTFTEDITMELTSQVDNVLGEMLNELYGGRLLNCLDRCIAFAFESVVSPALLGEMKRRTFHWLQHLVEFRILRPLDFVLLTERDNTNKFVILKIWFNGRTFLNLGDVLGYYERQKGSIQRVPFPDTSRRSTLSLNARGKPRFSKPLRNPTQVSPDGKRYTIVDRHISYGDWNLEIEMSILTGPRINDIRFKNERIAYEISLKEIANFYSGYRPFEYTMNFLDTTYNIGLAAKFLMPGVDCPHDSTFLSSYFKIEGKDEPEYNANAFCVFEWNTGIPLRRHSGYYMNKHRFYEGVGSIAMVVRTIPTVGIYDYIIDFIFYQNGVFEAKVTPTGTVVSTWFGRKNPYSFQLHDNIMAPLHQHMVHLKMDLDIKGTSNRFETLDIESVEIKNEVNKDQFATLDQERFIQRLKRTELEAAYQFKFDSPTQLTFVNDKKRDKYGNRPSYKLVNKGMTKLLRSTTKGNGPALSWAKYQVAVTKHKDSEPSSTSKYAISEDTVVDFQNFINDDENIVDEDLVAWVSMGFYHITHKEDIPTTHTPGLGVSTYLVPFNYFDESPGMSAENAIRVDPRDVNGKTVGVNIRRFGVENDVDCVPKRNRINEILEENPCIAVPCL